MKADNNKPVYKMCPITDKILKEYSSLSEAARDYADTREARKDIRAVAEGKRQFFDKHHWQFKYDRCSQEELEEFIDTRVLAEEFIKKEPDSYKLTKQHRVYTLYYFHPEFQDDFKLVFKDPTYKRNIK